jgi:hypothetical protein
MLIPAPPKICVLVDLEFPSTESEVTYEDIVLDKLTWMIRAAFLVVVPLLKLLVAMRASVDVRLTKLSWALVRSVLAAFVPLVARSVL